MAGPWGKLYYNVSLCRSFYAYFQSSADDFASSRIVPMVAHGSGAIPAWQQQFYQIANQFASDRDVESAQTAFILAAEDAGFPQQ